MIKFDRWKLTGDIDARQNDDKSAVFTVTNLPKGYTWKLYWNFGANLDVLPLTLNENGNTASVVLEKKHLAFSGIYTAQLLGTDANGATKHTDKLELVISGSFDENEHWSEIPTAFDKYFAEHAKKIYDEVGETIVDAVKEDLPNFALSVNGKTADNKANITLGASDVGARPDTWTPSASDIGAVPKAGGDVNGYLDFRDTNAGLSWKTADGTIIHLRPWSPDNVLQLTMQNPTNGVSEFGAVNIKTDGTWGFSHAANVRKAIGAAPEDIYKFLPLSATTEYGGVITDALNINLVSPLGTQNKSGYVYVGGTSSLPAGFSNGIREVYYYSSEWVIIKLTGWDNTGHRPCVVYNTYRGSGIGWLGWEWENPPMVLGSEYRTTNRWMGKVVYKKLIDFGTLPNSTSKTLSLNMDSYQVIKLEMQAANGNETFCEIGGHAYNGTLFVYDGKLQVRTTSDVSSFNAYITVWYTKD